MIDKELLFEISALKLDRLDDTQMDQYERLLVSFIDSFSESEQKIKAALESKDKDSLVTHLETICAMLEKIQAAEIASDCRGFINSIKNSEYDNEKTEAYVTAFLGSAAMLSIDIQVAKYREKKTDTKSGKKKENAAAGEPGERIILAVDDAAISLTLLKKSLQGEPYKLVCVNSGETALRFLDNNDPDLFLLDIEMPKMNGYELAEKIRENGHEAPIIFLTGNSAKEYVMKAIKAGASDFVVKPICKENLTGKINKHLYLNNA